MEDNFYLCHSDGYESGPEQQGKRLSDQSSMAKIEKRNNYDEFTARCADVHHGFLNFRFLFCEYILL
jgi:hypothetical protein